MEVEQVMKDIINVIKSLAIMAETKKAHEKILVVKDWSNAVGLVFRHYYLSKSIIYHLVSI